MGKITIKDVAREAGVSISTVSNALNDVDVLLPATKAHILAVAKQLNYIPNLNGRNLKSSSTRVIGLFLNSLGGAYHGVLADAVERRCREFGYELIIFITKKSDSVMTNLLGKRIDGAIISGNEAGEAQVRTLQEEDIPVVFLDREVEDKKMAAVLFDSYLAGRMAADYLIARNCRSIGYLRGHLRAYDGSERDKGFLDRLKELGMELRKEHILEGRFSREAARQQTESLLQSGCSLPEAFFAANDESAIGCMEALQAAGIRIPQDIMILGCDDMELGRWFSPSLSTIKTSIEKQGFLAADRLIGMLTGEKTGCVEKLAGVLVERESTGSSCAGTTER